jgi:predicted DCC family thiol-disulfide oxidoreductase YuxK
MKKSLILFDGICNLCNGFVRFVIRYDKHSQFMFGSLQSSMAQNILKQFNVQNLKLNTIVLIEDNKIFIQSTAVLKILKRLRFWNFFLY